ncbi:MAG: helix-turn-helix domain-containing protein [Nitriliruptorales bacterium]|nr:helix-turn-helix domain-containing protein [Nitriliruptorales bacterium]
MSDTREQILDAARTCLLRDGYANLSTRAIADEAGLRMGHLHYHFGSKRNLVLAVLDAENQRRLDRQEEMYGAEAPLWKQWEQACDFLEDDLESGYVRILQEMIAAGWTEPDIAERVRAMLGGWYDLLTSVAQRAQREIGSFGPFIPAEVAALVGDAFIGAEALVLLGFSEERIPQRAALRKVGELIRLAEET